MTKVILGRLLFDLPPKYFRDSFKFRSMPPCKSLRGFFLEARIGKGHDCGIRIRGSASQTHVDETKRQVLR
jgi:hypothetical protein